MVDPVALVPKDGLNLMRTSPGGSIHATPSVVLEWIALGLVDEKDVEKGEHWWTVRNP